MKKFIPIFLMSLLLLGSCTKDDVFGADLHAEMREAAKTYYTALMDSDYDAFADGICVSQLNIEGSSADSLPADYRRQLACDAAQLMTSEAQSRGGIKAFSIMGDSLYTDSLSGHVNICLTFGDSTQENTCLHLVRTQQGWKME